MVSDKDRCIRTFLNVNIFDKLDVSNDDTTLLPLLLSQPLFGAVAGEAPKLESVGGHVVGVLTLKLGP